VSTGAGYVTHAAQIFAGVVARQPAAVALRWADGREVSYEQLDRGANRLMGELLRAGVGKRQTVAIATDKCDVAYAAILACLKIGAPYFMVDPASPVPRARAIVEQCVPAYAVVGARAPAVFECPTHRISPEGRLESLEEYPEQPPDVAAAIDGSDPAYIMFTSGSTGTPKGATMSQANLVNFIGWARTQYHIGPEDVVTNVNPLYFDNSVFDIYSSLFSGATLAPFGAVELSEPAALLAAFDRLGCTLYFSVPSLLVYFQRLKLIGPGSFTTMRRIVFGGEGYPKPMLQRLFAAIGDRVELHNVYGPTECTCICSSYRITAADFADLDGYPPLGQLVPNFSHVIADEQGRAVPPGTVGELYLGGPCVGLGYYAAPGQTAAAFVQNPCHARFHDRMYRTGDLVRLNADDGKLHFVGRVDSQIKLQGYRIELGEIEHAMQRLAGVDEAAAIFTNDGTIARITGVAAGSAILADAMRRDLAALLPRYMIPERIVVVQGLPKNANGKIDRSALTSAIRRGEL
jgi:D-alanine--poly(phosphoribitol) ligase subunit 1